MLFLDTVESFKFVEATFYKLWVFSCIRGDIYFCKYVGFQFQYERLYDNPDKQTCLRSVSTSFVKTCLGISAFCDFKGI